MVPDRFMVPDTVSVEDRLDLMESIVEDAAADPRIASAARAAVAGVSDPREKLQRLLDALHGAVTYEDDCRDGSCEEYQRPDYLLFVSRRGDCEDMSMLYASMARAVGLGAKVVWIDQPEPAASNHAAVQACTPGGGLQSADNARRYAVNVRSSGLSSGCIPPLGSLWVETTLPGALVGEHPYAAAERLGARRADIAAPRAVW